MPARTNVREQPYSLRRRIAWRLLPPLVLLLAVNAAWSLKGARDAANRAYDHVLSASLRNIAGSVHATGGKISADIPYAALDISDEEIQGRIYYAIVSPDGTLLTGYDDLRYPFPLVLSETPRMVDMQYRQQTVRLGMLSKRLYDPELTGGDTVTVLFAETTEARNRLAFDLFMEAVRPQLLLIGVGLVLVLIVLNYTFRPLLDLRDSIRQRAEEDLTPVSQANVPNELHPLIDAINFHMARLGRMLQARRRFLADAAHQIRTPLTVLSTQAEYGQRLNDPEEMRHTFAGLLDCIRSTRRMANQMLSMARAEPANGLLRNPAILDFCELSREVAGELANVALRKHIDLAFESPDAPVFISGDATLLHEMVANLVDNALRYTPEGGHVTLSIREDAKEVTLCVVDDGPGIPVSERDKVFQRFYRILGQGSTEGSGLGLAIVREICLAHRGKIELSTGPDNHGLKVEVSFPAARRP
ncbi:MAG: sensor histidine kinase [Propionivibrio sp.]